MISPTVLNTLHGTQDIPTFIMISPHGTEHPHGTHDIPPRYSWYPPTVLNTPHGTEHPPRYCTHIIQGDWSEKGYFHIEVTVKLLSFGTFLLRNKWLGPFSISNKFVGPVLTLLRSVSFLYWLTKTRKATEFLKFSDTRQNSKMELPGKNYRFSEINSLYFNPLHH